MIEKEILVSEILNRIVRRKYSKYRGERKGGGHGFVLFYLMEHGGNALPGEIGQKMGVSTARVAVILKDLEQDGFIVRTIVADDRRKICVSLTEAGQHKVKSKKKALEEFVCQLVQRLTVEDANAFCRILDTIETLQNEKWEHLHPDEN